MGRLQVLAATLIIVCLVGGLLVYTRVPKSSQTATPGRLGWCISSGAPLDTRNGVPALETITAITPNNIWAMGYTEQGDYSSNKNQEAPLLEHWNGTEWSIVPTANTTSLINALKKGITGAFNQDIEFGDLAVVSANDIWVVGSIDVWQYNPTGASTTVNLQRSLIEHWNGSQWQLVASPGDANDNLESVAVVTANDIWAVGSRVPDSQNPVQTVPLVEHWNGLNWTVTQLPATLQQGMLQTVKVISADDIWLFGTASLEVPPFPALIAHWDGKSWNVLPLTDPLSTANIDGVTALAPDNIWLVGGSGFSPAGGGPTSYLFAHWDGSKWNTVAGPKGMSKNDNIVGISAINANNIWAVGYTATYKTQIEHWNGQNWTIVTQKTAPSGELNDVTVVGGKIWAVGYTLPGNAQKLSQAGTPSDPTGILIETNC